MKSSPDTERVKLPTFEEMTGIRISYDAAEPSEAEAEANADAQEELPEKQPERSEAEEELERVEKLCEGMRREAIAQSKQIVQQAREEAVAIEHKALLHGREQIKAEMEAERAKLQGAAVDAAKMLREANKALLRELEPYFIDTALTIAERILTYELDRNSEAYISIVRNMVEQTYMAHDVVLHLPNGKFKELTEDFGSPFMEEMARHGVKVERDASLAENDCLVTSNMGSIKGGAKTQLARMRHAIEGQEIR